MSAIICEVFISSLVHLKQKLKASIWLLIYGIQWGRNVTRIGGQSLYIATYIIYINILQGITRSLWSGHIIKVEFHCIRVMVLLYMCKAQLACVACYCWGVGGMPPGNFWKIYALRLNLRALFLESKYLAIWCVLVCQINVKLRVICISICIATPLWHGEYSYRREWIVMFIIYIT